MTSPKVDVSLIGSTSFSIALNEEASIINNIILKVIYVNKEGKKIKIFDSLKSDYFHDMTSCYGQNFKYGYSDIYTLTLSEQIINSEIFQNLYFLKYTINTSYKNNKIEIIIVLEEVFEDEKLSTLITNCNINTYFSKVPKNTIEKINFDEVNSKTIVKMSKANNKLLIDNLGYNFINDGYEVYVCYKIQSKILIIPLSNINILYNEGSIDLEINQNIINFLKLNLNTYSIFTSTNTGDGNIIIITLGGGNIFK